MFSSITHHSIFVLDQDRALDFYVGKLGLEVAIRIAQPAPQPLEVPLPAQQA